MNILSQAKSPAGVIQPWANSKIGTSNNLIWARGDQLTLLAEIVGMTPTEVNNTLLGASAFDGDQIVWEKLYVAFPEWSAQVITPYNNEFVLQALQTNREVIVLTDKQAVRYMGGGLCHDPKTGTERPTLDFPEVQSFIVLTHIPKVEVQPETPKAEVPEFIEVKPEDIKSENMNVAVKVPKNKVVPTTDIAPSRLTTKERNTIKKQLKQIHVASLALKKLLSL